MAVDVFHRVLGAGVGIEAFDEPDFEGDGGDVADRKWFVGHLED